MNKHVDEFNTLNIESSLTEAELPALLYEKIRSKFYSDSSRLGRFIDGYFNEAEGFFYNASSIILATKPSNVIFSLTDSKSLHFKIFNSPNFETHLEVFYSKDDENDSIEGVISIFENEIEIYKDFGELNSIAPKYYKIIGCNMESISAEDLEENVTCI